MSGELLTNAAPLVFHLRIIKGVSGTEMLCGSSGQFADECATIPSGTDECSETYQEIEEDESLLDVLANQRTEQELEQGEEGDETVVLTSGYGGTGGVGALNPGAAGRDHPEYTATLNGWGGVVDPDNSSYAGTINDYDSDLETIEDEPWSGSAFPGSVAITIETDSSWATRTTASTTVALATLWMPFVGFMFV
jgi:hypothetical protein